MSQATWRALWKARYTPFSSSGRKWINKFRAPGGYAVEQHMATLPTDAEHYSTKWDGEWHIAYEVFRDLGIALAAVLISFMA
jgi:hypothetical protein